MSLPFSDKSKKLIESTTLNAISRKNGSISPEHLFEEILKDVYGIPVLLLKENVTLCLDAKLGVILCKYSLNDLLLSKYEYVKKTS